MKKIYLALIIGILLFEIGFAVKLMTIDKIKIDVVELDEENNEYRIYKLSEVTNDTQLAKDKARLLNRRTELLEEQAEFDLIKEDLLNSCLSHNAKMEKLQKTRDLIKIKENDLYFFDCYMEQELMENMYINNLRKINYKLEELNKIK